MYSWARHILVLTIVLFTLHGQHPAFARKDDNPKNQRNYSGQLHSDTMMRRVSTQKRSKSDAFYDTLANKQYKNPISRFLARSLVRSGNLYDEGRPILNYRANRKYFENFSGKKISAIHIIQADIFAPRDSADKANFFQRFADNIHIKTRRKQLVQNLFFHVGDTINPYVMGIAEEYMRALPFLSTAYFVVTPDLQDSTGVNVNIFARDNWSLGGDLKLSGTRKRIEINDRNFLGTTDEIKLTYTSDKIINNPGFETSYTFRNLAGSFMDLTLKLGFGSGQNTGMIITERPFLLPTDQAWGVTVGHIYDREKQRLTDTSLYIDRFQLDAWYGRSWCLNWNNGTNVYAAVTAEKENYLKRPEVTERYNPFYHNTKTVLISVGFSRRNYFQGNMIYGYGRTEDIPYGFRTEGVFGRQWSEKLDIREYIGVKGSWGNLIKDHYLSACFEAGTFLKGNKLQQSVIVGELSYFSPLTRIRTNFLRQFITLSMVMGFHRLEGEQEALRYERERSIRGLRTKGIHHGYNRLILSSETVVFTPLFLYNFRFAFFGFGDVGWLGNNNNFFDNKFTGSVGVGVRIRNERLIFNRIQIRVGVAFNRPKDVGYSNFSASYDTDFRQTAFQPDKPSIVEYR